MVIDIEAKKSSKSRKMLRAIDRITKYIKG